MIIPRHRTLEFRILDVLWRQGPCSMKEVQDGLPEQHRPSYETVRSIMYRLQSRQAIKRFKKVGKAQIFEAAIGRDQAQEQLIDDFASLFAPDIGPIIDRLVATGRLTLDDLREAERLLGQGPKRADLA